MSLTATPGQETVAPPRRPHLGILSTCTLRHASDDRLVALTRAGSERAFAEIMRRYQRPLQFYCSHMVGAPRAEDVVQQAFMQAFVSLRDGAQREIALRPWLYRITRNCAIDMLRKQPVDHDELDPDFDGMPQPPGVFEQKEELARVVAAIQALPEGQRRALTLRELEGRSYGEISAVLGHSDSGVRQLIFRARTALRNLGALALPLGSVRWRLFGPAAPAGDPYQVVAAASLSSGGGGGALQTAGSVAAATLALLASGAPAGRQNSNAATPPAPIEAAAPPHAASSALVGAGTPAVAPSGRSGRAFDLLGSGPSGGAPEAELGHSPVASAAPVPPAAEPPIVAAPPDAPDGRAPAAVGALGGPGGAEQAPTAPPNGAGADAPAESGQAPATPTQQAGAQAKPAPSGKVAAPKPPRPPAAPKVAPPQPAAPKKPAPPRPPARPQKPSPAPA